MSFKFLGEGAGVAPSGGNVALWVYKTKSFTNVAPEWGSSFRIWNPNDTRFPEPNSAHILFYTVAGWMQDAALATREDHPPNCGCAFGYMKWNKGSIPQVIYGWRGGHANAYPYDYTDLTRYSGFNTTASTNGAWMLPNPGSNDFFTQSRPRCGSQCQRQLDEGLQRWQWALVGQRKGNIIPYRCARFKWEHLR